MAHQHSDSQSRPPRAVHRLVTAHEHPRWMSLTVVLGVFLVTSAITAAGDLPPADPGVPNGGRYASLTVNVRAEKLRPVARIEGKRGKKHVTAIDLVPVEGVQVFMTTYRHYNNASKWNRIAELRGRTGPKGIAFTDHLDLTGSSSGGKAFIHRPRNNSENEIRLCDIRCDFRVEAPNYAASLGTIILTYEKPKREIEVTLRRITKPGWVRDSIDEMAFRGRHRKEPRGRLVSFPVFVVKVLDQNGRPVEGATVHLRPVTARKGDSPPPIRLQARKGGVVHFHPRLFEPFNLLEIVDQRPALVGEHDKSAGRLSESVLKVELKVTANGFRKSYQTAEVRTLSPKAEVVFHIEPTKHTNEDW